MAQFLRTATPMGDWRSFRATCVNTAGHHAGDLVLIEDTVGQVLIGVPPLDANGCVKDPPVQLGDEFVIIYHAEKTIVEKTQQIICLKGQKVYWDGIDGDPVTNVDTSGYYWIGIFTEDAGFLDTTAEIDLLGNKATLLE